MNKMMALALSLLLVISGSWAVAEDEQTSNVDSLEATSSSSETDARGSYRSRKFLNLTVGIEADEKLPPLPENVEFKGDFRRYLTASYAKDLGIIRFIPKAEGFATLTVHDKRNGKIVAEYRIDIKKSKLDKVVREMRALLGDIEGINIKIVNNKVVVDGQILLPKDLSRIYNVVQQFGEQASSLVSLSPLAQKKIAEFISRDINNPEIEVRAVNDKIILQGWANSEDESKRAEIIAKTYLPDIVIDAAEEKGVIKKRRPANDGVINLIQIKEAAPKAPAKMIQVVFHFVELSKNYGKAFNFQFTPTLNDAGTQVTVQAGGNTAGGVVSSITAVIDNLLPKLNWAKTHGHAKILESTTLLVEDGLKGDITQVTKQPYPVVGKDGIQGTAFADIGLKTSVTPTLLGEKSGSIKLQMHFEISSLVNVINGAPVTSQNELNSTVTVRDRQSAAVGGLIRNSTSTDYNRPVPGNPIISLYASKEFNKQQTQFVVFVTPMVKTSASAGAEQIKKKFRMRD